MKARRIERERQKLQELGKYTISIMNQDDALIRLTSGYNVRIKFGDHYPFKKPEIFIDGKEYSDFLVIKKNKNTRELLKKMFNEKCCFVCSSLACPENWNTCMTVEKILVDIEHKTRMKEQMMVEIEVEKIKTKGLIPQHINITDYV